MSEKTEKPQMPDFKSMPIEQKIDYLAMRISNTDSIMASYIRYRKQDEKFARHYKKEQEAARLQFEAKQKQQKEEKAKVAKIKE